MKTKLLFFLLFMSYLSNAQIGGESAFPFLDLSYSARSMGLGGDFISANDDDISIGVANPSLLSSDMANNIAYNHSMMAGGINYGMANYGYNLKDKATMVSYIKYISYGTFDRRAVNGVAEGTFSPFEMVAGTGIGKNLNERLSIGANLNLIFSQLESYSSFGAAIDMAGTYYDPELDLMVTALVKNAGMQFKTYVKDGQRNPLPAEIQLAGSYKLAHAPFRFTLLGHHLNTWDISYQDPNLKPTVDPLTGDTIPVKYPGFGEKLAHHFSYQLEALISKNIHFRVGFDYHRRRELALEQRPGISGFSFGLGLYFSKFSLDYGFLIYSRSGFNNMITLTTNLSKWRN